MVRSIIRMVGVVLVVSWCSAADAETLGPALDLSNFSQKQEFVDASSPTSDDLQFENVAMRLRNSPRRFYLSGMLGPSFADVTSPVDGSVSSKDTLLSAGGALGIAFERPRGWLRLELEGMGRDTYHAPFNNAPSAANYTVLTNNWSVMQNVWRDVMFTERFGIYGGGGIGAGGYILGEQLDTEVRYAPPGSSFAWQFGGGMLWNITDRLTFDVGYRYFTIDTIQQASYVWPNHFETSELMFSLRFYEPFRSWRR